MKIQLPVSLVALLVVISAATVLAGPPEVPATPAAVEAVLYAQPFTLETPYHSAWQAEQPEVRSGLILVLQVNPDLVFPRQSLEPVLFVGDQTAERVNTGYPSGRVVAIVPNVTELGSAPIWFGAPELPERVTAAMIKDQLSLAREAGIGPFSAGALESAITAGGEPFSARDQDALRRHAAELILEYAPDEHERAEGILAPRVGE